MNTYDPNNNELAAALNDIRNRLYDLEHAGQPDISDWFRTNPSEYSRQTNGIFQTNEEELKRWTVGDKIWWAHSIDSPVDTRSGYVYRVDRINNRIYVVSEKVVDASDITFLYQSKRAGPREFPNGILVGTSGGTDQLVITVPSGSINPGSSSRAILNLVGSLVFVTYDISCSITSGSPSYIQVELPVVGPNGFVLMDREPVGFNNAGFVEGYASGGYTSYLRYYKNSGNWGGSISFTHNFFYYLDDLSI